MKLEKRLHAIWWVIKYVWVMDLITSNLGIASQWLNMNDQFWLQKRSFSMNATLGMVSPLPLPLLWFWYDWWGVPVIAVLTKADTLNLPACQQIKEEGLAICEEILPRIADVASQLLSNLRGEIESQLKDSKYPPKAYLSLASELWRIWYHVCSKWKLCSGMNQEGADCTSLLRCTTDTLDGAELQKLLICTQQANIVLNMEYAVKR